jgi:hypothetical protein
MKTESAVGDIRIHFESRAHRRQFVTLVEAGLAAFVFASSSINGKEGNTGAWIISGCLILCLGLARSLPALSGDPIRSRRSCL